MKGRKKNKLRKAATQLQAVRSMSQGFGAIIDVTAQLINLFEDIAAAKAVKDPQAETTEDIDFEIVPPKQLHNGNSKTETGA